MVKEGIIVKTISDSFTIECEGKETLCKARGVFRKEKITPLVGDRVLFDEDKCYIMDILPRANELLRPNVANVDIALIVTSLKKPDLSLNLLDKLISMVTINKVTPVICLTKKDLVPKDELNNYEKLFSYYEKIGIRVIDNRDESKLYEVLKDKTVVLAGQTGAGKSSLLNYLCSDLNLNTAPISEALGRGKHTTRHSELFIINGVRFLDTPGFSALEISKYSEEQLRNSFIEFNNYKCLYNDCNHINTEGCEVVKALHDNEILASRYESYCSFMKQR